MIWQHGLVKPYISLSSPGDYRFIAQMYANCVYRRRVILHSMHVLYILFIDVAYYTYFCIYIYVYKCLYVCTGNRVLTGETMISETLFVTHCCGQCANHAAMTNPSKPNWLRLNAFTQWSQQRVHSGQERFFTELLHLTLAQWYYFVWGINEVTSL